MLGSRLLHLLPEPQLLRFANGVLDEVAYAGSSSGGGAPGGAAEAHSPTAPAAATTSALAAARGAAGAVDAGAWLVFRGVTWPSLDQLLPAAACGCSLLHLSRLIAVGVEEEDEGAVVRGGGQDVGGNQ